MHDQRAHKDICIQFELGGQAFEAVGFFAAEERSVIGEEAISRVDNEHLVCSDADWRFVYEHRAELPPELRIYCLVTRRLPPGSRCSVSSLFYHVHDVFGWCEGQCEPNRPWYRNVLGLRRRVSLDSP